MNRALFKVACLQYLTIPYRWGGEDPISGYDCSGFAQEVLSWMGLDPSGDQNAQALYDHFKDRSLEGPRDAGDLVFYGKSTSKITHIAIMLDHETCIEAGGGGSKTLSIQDSINQKAFVRLRPFNRRSDIVAVLKPKGIPWYLK